VDRHAFPKGILWAEHYYVHLVFMMYLRVQPVHHQQVVVHMVHVKFRAVVAHNQEVVMTDVEVPGQKAGHVIPSHAPQVVQMNVHIQDKQPAAAVTDYPVEITTLIHVWNGAEV